MTYDQKEYQRAYRSRNKERLRAKNKEWAQRNPELLYWYNVKQRYGITREQWELLFERQGRRCAICRTDTPGGRGKRRGWHVDHDHGTGQVRGLLCYGCNGGLGFFKENPDVLEAALRYLETPAESQQPTLWDEAS